jgi:oxalate decarboxylase/phosphoglucose isomerase-like protein (cupin superfamily)
MAQPPRPIPEWHDVDAATFATEILGAYRPAVLRGAARDWPAVRHALQSPEALAKYLHGFDSGKPVDVLMMPPHVKGRIFYADGMNGFNYTRSQAPITAVNEKLLRYAAFGNKPAVVVQSAPIADCLPGFAAGNRLALLDDSIAPRIWLGNAVVTPAHFDESHNVACVVSGRRRFTLFPPEQIANLYIGPIGYAPTGTPISLVSFLEPDFERFPKFRDALAAAQVAELEPGDALYIPALWWHHVESLAKHNMLVNYWWTGAMGSNARPDSALDPLLHCLLNLRHLDPEQRKAWGAIFNHYVFGAGEESAAHIPESKRGVLGEMSPEYARQVKAFLADKLKG